MSEVTHVIEDIRRFLANAADAPPPEAIAPEYVRWRQEAARRLEECAALLEKGGEHQAVMAAEVQPPLMDLLTQLSFSEEPQWLEYCSAHGLPTPPKLHGATIQSLREIYAKGISPTSGFYREYRAAVTARDDEQALRIMRSIVRLNPSDARSHAELARLQNKKVLIRLDDLKAAIGRGDQAAVTALVDEIEMLGTEDKLSHHAAYVEGVLIRRSILQENATKEAVILLGQAQDKKNTGDWKGVDVAVFRIRRLQKEPGLRLSEGDKSRLAALSDYVKTERADVGAREDYSKALGTLSAFANKVQERLGSSPALTLKEAQKLQSTLSFYLKRVLGFNRPVPQAEMTRIQGTFGDIDRAVARKRGKKSAGKALLILGSVTILGAAAWMSYAYLKAYNYIAQLKDLRSRELAGAASKLVEAIPLTAPWGATSVPALQAQMDEVGQWVKGETKRLQLAEQQLDELEKAAAGDFVGLSADALHSRVTSVAESIKHLAADLGAAPEDRLKHLQSRIEQHDRLTGDRLVGDMRAHLTELALLVRKLDFAKPSSEAGPVMEKINGLVNEIQKARQSAGSEFRLPAELEAQSKELLDQADVFSKELDGLARAKQEIAQATSLEAYRTAIKSYSKLRFAEVGIAGRVASEVPSADSFAAHVFFGGDLEAWQLANKESTSGCRFYPKDVDATEIRRLLALRDDPRLNASGSGKRLLEIADINGIFNADGKEYRAPLISRIDKVVRNSEGDPIIKAYFVQEFYLTMAQRRNQWGLHYSHGLYDDMTELGVILGVYSPSRGDWSDSKVREKFALKLKQFFTKVAQQKPYLEQAGDYYKLVSPAVSSGLVYAGYVDAKRAIHLQPTGASATQLLGLAEESGTPMTVEFAAGIAKQGQLAKLSPWSPLFKAPMSVEIQPSENRKP